MRLTVEQKERIRNGALVFADRFATRNQCANALQINVAQFSEAITKGKLNGVISDAKWVDIARKIGVSIKEQKELKIAMTKMVIYLTEQFEICQRNGTSGILCDISDSGKTVAARYYTATHRNALRIDCSIFKSKRRLINEIARQLGVPRKGNYWEQYDALVWQINNSDGLFIILDEAGDLQYEAFLEIKGLWNATEGNCAWFMLGADALRRKMEIGRELDRVGFNEMFTRFGAKYQSCFAENVEEKQKELITQVAMVAKLNTAEGTDIQRLVNECGGSLRRLRDLILNKDLKSVV